MSAEIKKQLFALRFMPGLKRLRPFQPADLQPSSRVLCGLMGVLSAVIKTAHARYLLRVRDSYRAAFLQRVFIEKGIQTCF